MEAQNAVGDRWFAGTIYRVLAAAALVLLAWICFCLITEKALLVDDAFIAGVARNLAIGNGYSSAYCGIRPFDVEITTGPLLVLPAAALISVFGNQFWVPNLTATICIWASLLLVLLRVRPLLGRGEMAPFLFVMALGLATFAPRDFGLLGETPAALFVAAAGLTVMSAQTRRSLLVPGLLLGVALTTKTVSALAVPAFFAALVFMTRSPGRWQGAAWFAAGLAIAPACFAAWRMAASAAGATELHDIVGANSPISGMSTLREVWDRPAIVLEIARVNLGIFLRWWGGWLPTVSAIGVTAALLWINRRRARNPSSDALAQGAMILLGAALIHTIWWFLLARMGWLRHLTPAVFYWLAAVAALVALAARHRPRVTLVVVAVLTLTIPPGVLTHTDSFVESLKRSAENIRTGPVKSERLKALLATTEFVRTLQGDPNVVLMGCGWWHNPDVDFLLPQPANFRDCIDLRPSQVTGKRLVLVRNDFFNAGNKATPAEMEHGLELAHVLSRFRQSCERRVLFSREPFVVSECAGLPVF